MYQPTASCPPQQPVMLCPAAVTDPDLLGGVLSVLSDQDLAKVGVLVNEHTQQRLQASVLAELRTVVAQAIEDGEAESPAEVTQVRVHVRQVDSMPPYWSARNLTLRHADGISTFCYDASHTDLDVLLTDYTCVNQPSDADVLTIDLHTGRFHH
ncbi:hypothetical protein [Streptomyces noursei]|uniref:hypothetical protein n=1 Tax=Streptomyces noursei TaxID=1971 RepID=UPI00167852C5|nr:hypothetical protein [Streptomyces noursei]MCZ1021448.1 hypothetical protein [Streptomyces noursei]GGX46527.1 hypothetical protein GCM10010341_80360 [Streptomyces noursei]